MDDQDSQAVAVFKSQLILLVATVLVLLVRFLSSRRSRITRGTLGRYFLSGASTAYFSLIAYFFSYLTTYMTASLFRPDVLMLVVLLQFLKSNADMAAKAVATAASPTVGGDDQKINPTMESLVSSFWLTSIIGYYIVKDGLLGHLYQFYCFYILLWAVGVARMVLTFVAFQRANDSFAAGWNPQLIEGYMAQLQDDGHLGERVPRLIVTGEKNVDVEESPQGYRVRVNPSRLVTLVNVWESSRFSPEPEIKDLCLSFSLFKCLRRRFSGHWLAEAGSSWAFRFVCDGLLGPEDDHGRIFKVISTELSFASDFCYSPLPVASLGAWSAALYYFLSALVCIFTLLNLILVFVSGVGDGSIMMPILVPVIALVTLSVEISEMVTSVRSNWTKISMAGHSINRSCWYWVIRPCLFRCKPPLHWKDKMGQNLLLKPPSLLPCCVRLFNRNKSAIKISPDVKNAIITSLKKSGGELRNGVATIQRWCSPHFTWPVCYNRVTTSTDTILVWYVATFLVEIKCSSAAAPPTTNMTVATGLSRYCAYLVADAPDLLPDNAAWTKRRYQKVKRCIEVMCKRSTTTAAAIQSFGRDNNQDTAGVAGSGHGNQLTEEEVLKIGSKLGKQLVEESDRRRDSGGQEAVWQALADLWSEMILYLAPTDNVKGHIETLRRGGELITLLWVLLLHAGITSRPGREVLILDEGV